MTSIIKKILIIAVVFIGLVLGAQFAASQFIPAEQAELKLREGLAKAGFELEGKITPSFTLRAGIQLSVPDINIHGVDGQLKKVRVHADSMVAMLPISSLWRDFAVQEVYLRGTKITYITEPPAVAESAVPEPAKEPALANLVLLVSAIEPLAYDVHILDGTVLLSSDATAKPGAESGKPFVEHLVVDLTSQASGWNLSGRGDLQGKATEIHIGNAAGADNARDVQLAVKSDVLAIEYRGSRNAATPPLIQGHIAIDSADSNALHDFLNGGEATPAAAAADKPAATPQPVADAAPVDPLTQAAPLPVAAKPEAKPGSVIAEAVKTGGAIHFASDLFYSQGQIVAKQIDLTMPGLQMKGDAGGTLAAPYNIKSNLVFETLNTDGLMNLGGAAEDSWLPGLLTIGLKEKAVASVLIKAPKVEGILRGEDLSTLLELKDGTASISQFSLSMPGKSSLNFEGGFAVTPQGPTLIGKMSAQGEQFHLFLPAVVAMPIALPEQAFGAFAFATDIRVSPEDVRLSNARAKVNNTVLNVAYIHQFVNKDTGIRLGINGLNLDALLSAEAGALMKMPHKSESTKTQILPTYLQNVLLGLRSNYNIYLYAENYIYDGAPRDPLEVRLRASRGRADLEQFATRLNGADVSFTGFVDIANSIPKFKADMQFGDLDMARFQEWMMNDAAKPETPAAPNAPAPESPEGTRWSNTGLNWDFIPLADGTISIRAARILHPALTLANANINFHISNETLTMEESTASLFNADMRLKGQLNGGALPSWQGSFSVANLEVAEMRRIFPWLQSVQGRISISGAMASSGASQLAMIRNMKANIAFTGRAIQINEFDLGGAVDALRRMGSVDNVKLGLDAVLPRSNTRFDVMEGSLQVNAGAITVPRLIMRSNRFIGEIIGGGNLVDWTLETKTNFPLSVLRQEKPPVMTLITKGSLDAPTISRDDRNLEQYVVQKTANDMIQGK